MILVFALVWLLFLGIYLFLAGTVDTVEIVAGGLFAALGAALAVSLRQVAHRRLSLRLPPIRAFLRPLAALVPETVAVGRQLIATIFSGPRGQRGAFVRQPFDPGRDDDPVAAGRRALAVLGISLAPGSFAIRGERSDTMILHALPPRPASPNRTWPA